MKNVKILVLMPAAKMQNVRSHCMWHAVVVLMVWLVIHLSLVISQCYIYQVSTSIGLKI